MIKKETIIAGIVVAASITAISVVASVIGVAATWPAVFVVLLFMIAGHTDINKLKEIFCGGVVGVGTSWVFSLLMATLIGSLGLFPGMIIGIFGTIFLLVILGDPLPIAFNNNTFIYFLVASLFPEQQPITWIITLLVGGAIFAFLVMGGLKLFIKAPTVPELQK